jgi:NADPH-dependent 2,4-dienoyl-CoA reductase/sulfur reductase-like enzyme/Pyruvate/2-oxoacid:ferredoxin oxidoreductase delta subunit/bacterioferritin-associated ferredoxin
VSSNSSRAEGLRIGRHPVITRVQGRKVCFTLDGAAAEGIEGEAVSSSLLANGRAVFGHHSRDGSPQGLFCANGQCSQCNLLIDGVLLKSCIVPLREGMDVRTVEGLPELLDLPGPDVPPPSRIDIDVLVIGAGPAGLAAAIELGRRGLGVIVADDKEAPGGKLVLQTHKFFGSEADCYAGTRGTEIAGILAAELSGLPTVQLWLGATVLSCYSDGFVCVRRGESIVLVRPRHLLVAAGAREKSLAFPGNTLPGVFGAGAFQTLVNRDLVRCSDRLFVVGGGNVGLIASYHALQAGMKVLGLVEAMPRCGGYKVHADKIRRLGVPILTSHTVVAAHGGERLEAVTIGAVDERFRSIPGTERTFEVDTLLIAVGLDPVNEFYKKAVAFGIPVECAGDAEEIAEASAAMFSGRIHGMEISCRLGVCSDSVPENWAEKAAVLKSPGGRILPYAVPDSLTGVFPVLHCTQEIPCNPCMTSCPKNLIGTSGHPILGVPEYGSGCVGCEKCVAICPGLAVTLVDFRKSESRPVVTVPYELDTEGMKAGDVLALTDWEGGSLGTGILRGARQVPGVRSTVLLRIEVDAEKAARVAGIRVQRIEDLEPLGKPLGASAPDDSVVCRCERVTAGTIRAHLRRGARDLNEIKALTRCGFGACGGKTCRSLLQRICREEGIPEGEITLLTERPLFAETRLGSFSGRSSE